MTARDIIMSAAGLGGGQVVFFGYTNKSIYDTDPQIAIDSTNSKVYLAFGAMPSTGTQIERAVVLKLPTSLSSIDWCYYYSDGTTNSPFTSNYIRNMVVSSDGSRILMHFVGYNAGLRNYLILLNASGGIVSVKANYDTDAGPSGMAVTGNTAVVGGSAGTDYNGWPNMFLNAFDSTMGNSWSRYGDIGGTWNSVNGILPSGTDWIINGVWDDTYTFVEKRTSTGTLSWLRKINVSAGTSRTSISLVTLSDSSIVTMHSTYTSYRVYYLSKLTSTGNVTAHTQFYFPSVNFNPVGLTTDGSNIFVSGYNATSYDGIYLSKYNSSLVLQWTIKISGVSTTALGRTIGFNDGYIYLASRSTPGGVFGTNIVASIFKIPADGLNPGTYGSFTVSNVTLTTSSPSYSTITDSEALSTSTFYSATLTVSSFTDTTPTILSQPL